MNQIEPIEPIIEEIELTPVNVKGELQIDDDITPEPPKPFYVRHGLFLIVVVLPVIVAFAYFFLISSDRYVSEARFIIRSSTTTANAAGGLAAMIATGGLSRADDETYAVNAYLSSRDITALLVRNDHLREILARPEADFINRFPNFYTRDNNENLYRRYQSMIDAQIDSETGISTVAVTAFRPNDAHAVTAAALHYAEELVNRLNARAYDDAERYAQSIMDREQAHIDDIERRLTAYRNQSGTVNPGQEAVASFELIGKMTTDLALLQADLQQKAAGAPADPSLPTMRQQISSYQSEIDRLKLGIVGNDRSLATKLEGYEKLELEREFAARALGLAMVNLANAREDSHEQHLYLQTIVEPNVPDQPEYWMRIIGMLAVTLVSLAIFSIARAIGQIMLEHKS